MASSGRPVFPSTAESELDRHNQPDCFVAFDRAAMYQQIPDTLPPRYQSAVRSELDQMNTRMRPSAQYAMAAISRASGMKGEPIYLAHLLASLAFCHYHVHRTGRNAFLYRNLKAMGLVKCVRFTFPWGERLQGKRVLGDNGKPLRINVEDPPTRRNRSKR